MKKLWFSIVFLLFFVQSIFCAKEVIYENIYGQVYDEKIIEPGKIKGYLTHNLLLTLSDPKSDEKFSLQLIIYENEERSNEYLVDYFEDYIITRSYNRNPGNCECDKAVSFNLFGDEKLIGNNYLKNIDSNEAYINKNNKFYRLFVGDERQSFTSWVEHDIQKLSLYKTLANLDFNFPIISIVLKLKCIHFLILPTIKEYSVDLNNKQRDLIYFWLFNKHFKFRETL